MFENATMIQSQMRSRPQTPIRLSLFAFLLYLVGPNAVAPPQEASAAPGQATAGWPAFVDVASDSGITVLNITGDAEKDYIIEVNGNGAGFFDYDNDGDVDLVIANGSTMENHGNGGDPISFLYRNDGGQFVDVTASAGLTRNGWGVGVCIADYDNDGNRDVYLTAFGPNALFHNNGDGTFTDVTGEGGADDDRWSANCAFADYDRDGDVDLYVANYVAFSEEAIPRRGESDLCNFMGIEVFCGPRGTAGRARYALPQQRERHVYRCYPGSGESRIRTTSALGWRLRISTLTDGRTSTLPTTLYRICCSETTATALSRKLV